MCAAKIRESSNLPVNLSAEDCLSKYTVEECLDIANYLDENMIPEETALYHERINDELEQDRDIDITHSRKVVESSVMFVLSSGSQKPLSLSACSTYLQNPTQQSYSKDTYLQNLSCILNEAPSSINKLAPVLLRINDGLMRDWYSRRDTAKTLDQIMQQLIDSSSLKTLEEGIRFWRTVVIASRTSSGLIYRASDTFADVGRYFPIVSDKMSSNYYLSYPEGIFTWMNTPYFLSDRPMAAYSPLPNVTDDDFLAILRHRTAVVESIIENITGILDSEKDPFLYWNAVVTLLDAVNVNKQESQDLYRSMESLLTKAVASTDDEALKIFFELEFASITDTLSEEKIAILTQRLNSCEHGNSKKLDERGGTYNNDARYYAVRSRLWVHRYYFEITKMQQNINAVGSLEKELITNIEMSKKDRCNTPQWHTEVDYHLEAIATIVSFWSQAGGPMRELLFGSKDKVVNIEAVETRLQKLQWLAGFAENIVSKDENNVAHQLSGGMREKIALLYWNAYVDSYFAAGLFKSGLQNIQLVCRFKDTNIIQEKIKEYNRRWPSLVSSLGAVNLGAVDGKDASRARDYTASLFLTSKSFMREMLIPFGAGIGCSPAGPWASTGCVGLARVINQNVLAHENGAARLLEEAGTTGISLVDKSSYMDAKLWNVAGWGIDLTVARLGWNINRSTLSFIRGAIQFSAAFVLKGGMRVAYKQLLSKETWLALGGLIAKKSSPKQILSDNLVKWRKMMDEGVENRILELSAGGELKIIHPDKYIGLLYKHYGELIRVGTGSAIMGVDWASDGEVNTVPGVLGASLIFNEYFGGKVMGWNVNAGLTSFLWRFGIETLILRTQGFSVPPLDYMMVGLMTTYMVRGGNKLYMYGMGSIDDSKWFPKLLHWCATHRVQVPISVVGRQFIPSRHGMGTVVAHVIYSEEAGTGRIKDALRNIMAKKAFVTKGTSLGVSTVTDNQSKFYRALNGFLTQESSIVDARTLSPMPNLAKQWPPCFDRLGITLDIVKKKWGLTGELRVFGGKASRPGKKSPAPVIDRVAIVSDDNRIIILKHKTGNMIFAEELTVGDLKKLDAADSSKLVRLSLYDDINGKPVARSVFKNLDDVNSFRAKENGSSRRYFVHIDPIGEPTPIGTWFSQTTYASFKDTPLHRGVSKIVRSDSSDNMLARYWKKQGSDVRTDPSLAKGIFTSRGVVANYGFLPTIFAVKAIGALGQNADPAGAASIYTVDMLIAMTLTHRLQHLLKLDSVISTNIGYAVGLSYQKLLAKTFLTKPEDLKPFGDIMLEPNVSGGLSVLRELPMDNSYISYLRQGDYHSANKVVGQHLSSFGIGGALNLFQSDETSDPIGRPVNTTDLLETRRIMAYLKKHTELAMAANKVLDGVDLNDIVNPQEALQKRDKIRYSSPITLFNFADSLIQRSMEFGYMSSMGAEVGTPEVRQLIIDLAVFKQLSRSLELSNIHPYLEEVAELISPFMSLVPDIRTADGVNMLVQGLNRGVVMIPSLREPSPQRGFYSTYPFVPQGFEENEDIGPPILGSPQVDNLK